MVLREEEEGGGRVGCGEVEVAVKSERLGLEAVVLMVLG